MPLGTEVGLGLNDIVLDMEYGDPAPAPIKGTRGPNFLARVCCGQTARWIKVPLGTEVGFGPGHIVLDGDPAPPHGKGHNSPYRPMSTVAKRSPISATAELFQFNSIYFQIASVKVS